MVDGDLVFALGSNGNLICSETISGKEIWRKDLPTELEAEVNPMRGGPKKLGWGFTWSPLVDGEQLVCVPGGPRGTLAALNKKTGDVVWHSSEITDQATHTHRPWPRRFTPSGNMSCSLIAASSESLQPITGSRSSTRRSFMACGCTSPSGPVTVAS